MLPVEQDKNWQPTDQQGLVGVDPQVIMQRVANGELLRNIAKDYNVSRAAVSMHIRRHADKSHWQDVRELSIAARLEQAQEEMDAADDSVTLARARESARLWMWRAEREMPHIWGQRPTTAINVGGDGLQVQIVSYSSNNASQHEQIIDSDTHESE